ncbi:MAG: hypothetical protein OD814_000197 [Candidatus Alkanophagales archaeon MCA70_species_1]|nr:hypothetical protein [Candidatus Alkanophaga volatiphilum]
MGLKEVQKGWEKMAEMCGVCKENEATKKCEVCGIPLCDVCAREIEIEETHPSHRVKGVTTPGIIGEAVKKKVVCEKCMAEVDIF